MGAWAFRQYASGVDPAAAFQAAREQAFYENGYGGYTGTIAEKHEYVIVTCRPLPEAEAAALAGQLLDRADIRDKWGPAGAIPVRSDTRTIEVADLPQPGHGITLQGAELDTVIQICRERQLLTADETVESAWWNRATGSGTPPSGSAWLTLRRHRAQPAVQPEPDGWLFFGFASS